MSEETAKFLTGPGDSRLHSAQADALDPAELLVGKTLQMREREGGRCSNGRASRAASSWRDSSASEAARSGDRRSTTSGSSATATGRRRASSCGSGYGRW